MSRPKPHRAVPAKPGGEPLCDECGWPIHAAWKYVAGEPYLDWRHTSFPALSYRKARP